MQFLRNLPGVVVNSVGQEEFLFASLGQEYYLEVSSVFCTNGEMVVVASNRISYLGIGVQRSGTTALLERLLTHPEIGIVLNKEAHYFDDDQNFKSKLVDYTKYHEKFNFDPGKKIFGQITPSYIYQDCVAERVWSYNPDMKFIILLRNPIDRAYSHWNMEVLLGREKLSFLDAIVKEADRAKYALPRRDLQYSYIDRGYYVEQLRRFLRFFPREQFLILKNEYLKNEERKCLREISNFLNVRNFSDDSNFINHFHEYQCPMSKTEKNKLIEIYEYEIKNLERLLNWDCSYWLK